MDMGKVVGIMEGFFYWFEFCDLEKELDVGFDVVIDFDFIVGSRVNFEIVIKEFYCFYFKFVIEVFFFEVMDEVIKVVLEGYIFDLRYNIFDCFNNKGKKFY